MSEDCVHRWDTDGTVRLCLECGQVRTFPQGEENPRVLWPGRDAREDPLKLPQPDKVLIARLVKDHGIVPFSELTGLPTTTLRGWVPAYAPRDQNEKPAAGIPVQESPRKPRRSEIGRYYEQNKELIISDYQSMTLKAFFRKWQIASTTWIKLRTAWGVPKKGGRKTPRKPQPFDQEEESEATVSLAQQVTDLKIEVANLRGYREAIREILKSKG